MIFDYFQKRRRLPLGFLEVDVHSHLIAGIDDGSQSIEESLVLLQEMVKLGYKKMILTPHIMADSYKNTPEIIKEGLRILEQEAQKAGINIHLVCSAEYYVDDGFLSLIKAGELLPISEKYILFETSYYARPIELEMVIFELLMRGYTPLLAHPERYRYIKNPQKEYSKFKSLGVLFQVNINSFGGYYGKEAKAKALFLQKEGMIDFLGSDIHHRKQVKNLENVLKSTVFTSIFENNTIKNNSLI